MAAALLTSPALAQTGPSADTDVERGASLSVDYSEVRLAENLDFYFLDASAEHAFDDSALAVKLSAAVPFDGSPIGGDGIVKAMAGGRPDC